MFSLMNKAMCLPKLVLISFQLDNYAQNNKMLASKMVSKKSRFPFTKLIWFIVAGGIVWRHLTILCREKNEKENDPKLNCKIW